MSDIDTSDSPDGFAAHQSRQLSLAEVFWITTAVALILAYANSLGNEAVRQSLFYAAFTFVTAIAIGLWRKQLKEAFFWSTLVVVLAYLAVAGGNLPDPAISIGWGLVGALCGSISGLRIPKNFWLCVLLSTIAGGLAMWATVLAMQSPLSDLVRFDIGCAFVVGGVLKFFVAFIQWVESHHRFSRWLLAAWLCICVLTGNQIVMLMGISR